MEPAIRDSCDLCVLAGREEEAGRVGAATLPLEAEEEAASVGREEEEEEGRGFTESASSFSFSTASFQRRGPKGGEKRWEGERAGQRSHTQTEVREQKMVKRKNGGPK